MSLFVIFFRTSRPMLILSDVAGDAIEIADFNLSGIVWVAKVNQVSRGTSQPSHEFNVVNLIALM